MRGVRSVQKLIYTSWYSRVEGINVSAGFVKISQGTWRAEIDVEI